MLSYGRSRIFFEDKNTMKITIFSCSAGGLIASACLAEFGFSVSIVDFDEKKIADLQNGVVKTYEPGLDFILKKAQQKRLVEFSTDIETGLLDSEAAIIALSTTNKTTYEIDLKEFYASVQLIASKLKNTGYLPIIITSTVSIGVCSNIKRMIKGLRPDLVYGKNYSIICYTHFFRDGSAINDFLNPSRIIIGSDENPERAKEIIKKIFAPILHDDVRMIETNFESAELIRNASCGLALMKATFVNEIANLCSKVGADIDTIIKGIGLDEQAKGSNDIGVTPAAGGKIVRTSKILADTGGMLGAELLTLKGAIESNSQRSECIVQQIVSKIGQSDETNHKIVSIFGLTFKAHTEYIQGYVSMSVIKKLLELKFYILAYDPAYSNIGKQNKNLAEGLVANENFELCNTAYDAVGQSDAVVIMTNWPEFLNLNFNKIHELMNKSKGRAPIIIDFRNMFSAEEMKNFDYVSQGRVGMKGEMVARCRS